MQKNSMKDQNMLYEGMYVLNATLSEDARKKTIEKIKDGITSRGGEVLKIHDQGKRRLAYDINSHKEGYYVLMYFTAPTESISELWREYRLEENLIRFLTLTTDKVMEELSFKQLPEQ